MIFNAEIYYPKGYQLSGEMVRTKVQESPASEFCRNLDKGLQYKRLERLICEMCVPGGAFMRDLEPIRITSRRPEPERVGCGRRRPSRRLYCIADAA